MEPWGRGNYKRFQCLIIIGVLWSKTVSFTGFAVLACIRVHGSLMESIVQGTTLFYELLLFAEWEYDDVDREQRGSDGIVEQ